MFLLVTDGTSHFDTCMHVCMYVWMDGCLHTHTYVNFKKEFSSIDAVVYV